MKTDPKLTGAVLMSAIFVAVFGTVVVVSSGYPKAARLAPIWVSSTALVLALIQLGKDVFKLVRSLKAEGDQKSAGKKKPRGMPLWQVVVWLLAYFIAILTAGFWISSFVFTVVFLKFPGRRTWLGAGVPACLFAGTLYCLFELVLKVTMFPGYFFGATFG